MKIHARFVVVAVLLAWCGTDAAEGAKPPSAMNRGSSTGPLGSPGFYPTPEQPIGWRGDGSGRYPGATPPTVWQRTKSGSGGYTTQGIIWMAAMPANGVSSPIIVGDKIFLTSEVSDLECFDKKTGQLLWIRSNPEFEGLSPEEYKADAGFATKLAPLSKELAAANADVVTVLNAEMLNAPAARQADAALKRKRDIEKEIEKEEVAIDKKGFTHNWGQAVFGYSGPTPTSDGKHVCAFFTTGVSVCYDLNGNRKWIARGKGDGSEHGNFASPLLYGNRFMVWANELRGYDLETGRLLWTNPAKAFNTYGSLFRCQAGGEPVVGFQWGFFARIRDGQSIWDQGVFGDSVATPIVEGDIIFARVGYPKYNEQTAGFKAFKLPPSTEGGKLLPGYVFKSDWADDELPIDKKKNPFDRGFVASPLLVNGLIYQVSQGGGLLVNDASTGETVYRKVLPLKPKTEYWNWAGCSASPTLAGKYIYLMDNQGRTLVIQPGRQYKEVASNMLEESKDGKEQAQTLACPVFEGNRLYYRSPGFLYCIGDPRAPLATSSASPASSSSAGSAESTGSTGPAAEPAADQSQAIADLRKLGGKVRTDEKTAGHPVVSVDLTDANMNDENIAPLEGLSHIKILSLRHGYKLTDAALAHVKPLAELQSLDLRGTKITDAGLEELKELAKLRSLDLAATKVTDDGVKQLQEALPTCKITRH